MKQTMSILLLALSGMFLFLNYSVQEENHYSSSILEEMSTLTDTVVIEYKGKIKTIIDEKCYDCHSDKGDDEDAIEDLHWDKLPKLDQMDQVYALDAIVESVEKGEMPPEKHVRKYPNKKLTDEEAKLLMDWANDLADKLYE